MGKRIGNRVGQYSSGHGRGQKDSAGILPAGYTSERLGVRPRNARDNI